MSSLIKKKQLDIKWIELIKEAKLLGLTQDDIRLFLNKARKDS